MALQRPRVFLGNPFFILDYLIRILLNNASTGDNEDVVRNSP
jgi:hypothetical protein